MISFIRALFRKRPLSAWERELAALHAKEADERRRHARTAETVRAKRLLATRALSGDLR